jgi:murein L,D-transpeptidase YafK
VSSEDAARRGGDAGAPGGLALGPEGSPVRLGTPWVAGNDMAPADRVRSAQSRLGVVEELYRRAGVSFPPADLLLRAFKQERQVEVWASSEKGGRMAPIATYAVCAMSGDVGPKRAEGDHQVPEGFYSMKYFWPASAFHISANVGYPNALDRARGGAQPGGDIMIHGGCASVGCIAMTDERIEEIYVMSSPLLNRGARVAIHIFPGRDMARLIGSPEHARHKDFWVNLKEGLDFFEQQRRAPAVGSDWHGRYTFR